jgi:transcriptional regulator with XRE-family HTH domain
MIGERIRERRKALGLTQERLARAADIPTRVLTALERGETTDPRISTVAKLAKVLGCTTDCLIVEEAAPAPPDPKRGRKPGKGGPTR